MKFAVVADFGLKVRTEVLIDRRRLWSDITILVTEDEMKPVRFDGGRTGLMGAAHRLRRTGLLGQRFLGSR
jgi:hypothetical protein